jgi:regulatory protein
MTFKASFGDGSSGEPSGSPEDERDQSAAGESAGDPMSVARMICLRLLDQRARTRAELATALARKRVPQQAAETVLDRFEEVGLIDDEALAVSFAAARHLDRRLAPRAITAQLRRRGIEDETIAHAVAGIDGDSERRAARELVDAKLGRFEGIEISVATRRLTGMLARRGYSSAIAYATVREALHERGIDPVSFDSDV